MTDQDHPNANLNDRSVVIRNGRVIDPSQGMDQQADIIVQNGKVVGIEKPGQIPKGKAAREIDAKNLWVMPGFIDVHVHFREPGFEYKEDIESGSRAAIAGGFTSVACMANTKPVNDNRYVTSYIREQAKRVDLCRVYPVGAVTKGLKGEELAEIGGMVSEGAIALSDDGMPVMNSYMMRKAMDYAKAFDVAIISHAEDANLVGQGVMNEGPLSNELGLRGNPAAAEEIMVAREIALCRLTRCRTHLAHITTELALEHLRRAKDAGLPVTAEVSPHHLFLTDEEIRKYDTNYKMAPPLRTERDVEAMRAALAEGLVDMIATDHAPHGLIDKATEFDQASFGVIGLETAVPLTLELVHSGVISVARWIDSFTARPARLLKIPYGTLKIGAEADMTLLDPAAKWTFTHEEVASKSHNTPFIGEEFVGRVVHTLVSGRVR